MDRKEQIRGADAALRSHGASQDVLNAYRARQADRAARNVCTVCYSGLGHVAHDCTGVKE